MCMNVSYLTAKTTNLNGGTYYMPVSFLHKSMYFSCTTLLLEIKMLFFVVTLRSMVQQYYITKVWPFMKIYFIYIFAHWFQKRVYFPGVYMFLMEFMLFFYEFLRNVRFCCYLSVLNHTRPIERCSIAFFYDGCIGNTRSPLLITVYASVAFISS